MPRVALHTLGCKLNYAETSTIGKQFLDRGYELVEFGAPADVVVINTCTVTRRADRECRQLIRRALRTSGDPYVIVTGCYAQLEPEEIASISGVDLVLGAKEKSDLFAHAGELERGVAPRVLVSEVDDRFTSAFTTEAGLRTRAYLKVQDGCDYHCSFCTIPLARGESRSLPLQECVAQAAELTRQGYREIVLTGVNVGDYGRKEGESLLSLLHRLVRLEGLDRLRISSIEPNLLTDELLEFASANAVICPHFHIPLQSGSDQILKKMRRRYRAADYRSLLERVHQRLPHAGIGADVIVGFPGETESHFQETYRFLQDLPLSYLHVFSYSERPHTPAAQMDFPVAPEARHRRSSMLRNLGRMKRRAFCSSMIGHLTTILVEAEEVEGRRFGYTGNYVRVAIPASLGEENSLLRVRITGVEGDACLGEEVAE
jgi:threonylcarbamoyladenosine tRNA methylthiotransferase MtaB